MDWLKTFLLNTHFLSHYVEGKSLSEIQIITFSKITKKCYFEMNVYFKRSLLIEFPFLNKIKTPQKGDVFDNWIQLYYQFKHSALPYCILECIDLSIDMRFTGNYKLIPVRTSSKEFKMFKSKEFDINPKIFCHVSSIENFEIRRTSYFINSSDSNISIKTEMDPKDYLMSFGFFPFNDQKLSLNLKEKFKYAKQHIHNVLKDCILDRELIIKLQFSPFGLLYSDDENKSNISRQLLFDHNGFNYFTSFAFQEVESEFCFDDDEEFSFGAMMNFIDVDNLKAKIIH